jgi:hypothetical protein
MAGLTCVECGKHDDANYIDETRDDMLARSVCFTCRFWLDWIRDDQVRTDTLVAGGCHYVIGAEDGSRYVRGFGGARFHFVKDDGTEIVSTNVWYQGRVPEQFRDRMPDNARLVRS